MTHRSDAHAALGLPVSVRPHPPPPSRPPPGDAHPPAEQLVGDLEEAVAGAGDVAAEAAVALHLGEGVQQGGAWHAHACGRGTHAWAGRAECARWAGARVCKEGAGRGMHGLPAGQPQARAAGTGRAAPVLAECVHRRRSTGARSQEQPKWSGSRPQVRLLAFRLLEQSPGKARQGGRLTVEPELAVVHAVAAHLVAHVLDAHPRAWPHGLPGRGRDRGAPGRPAEVRARVAKPIMPPRLLTGFWSIC